MWTQVRQLLRKATVTRSVLVLPEFLLLPVLVGLEGPPASLAQLLLLSEPQFPFLQEAGAGLGDPKLNAWHFPGSERKTCSPGQGGGTSGQSSGELGCPGQPCVRTDRWPRQGAPSQGSLRSWARDEDWLRGCTIAGVQLHRTLGLITSSLRLEILNF